MPSPTRRDLIRTGAIGMGVAVLGAPPATASTNLPEFTFHFDHVLGTSLDACLWASDQNAAESAEFLSLAEIERLRTVFSVHDADSELSRLNRASGAFSASPDLLGVLREYEYWQAVSGGACHAQVGAFTRAWEQAAKLGVEPNSEALTVAVKRISSAGWTIQDNRVIRLTDQPLNLNSIAKGYILHRAAEVVRAVPGVVSGWINLGGDLTLWGDQEVVVDVQDPFAPAENSSPLTSVSVRNSAIATSGSYQRWYEVNGVRRSHLIDPRSGQPADRIVSATVIAPDSVTANVLATTACVLGVEAGFRLIASVPGAAGLLVHKDGNAHRSPNFITYERRVADDPIVENKSEKNAQAWPTDFVVTIKLELPNPGGRARRPYVAVWVEDANGKAVRTVSVWGNNPKWLATMSGWWKLGKDDKPLVRAVSRATRGPGKYELVWDGKDDAGKGVPQGSYTLKIEVHREHGKNVTQSGKLECKKDPAKITLDKNAEAGETTVEYARKERKDKK